MSEPVDVAVLGSGFGGSLLAILLRRIGLSCLLVERGHHPRFAIGESSTPIADLVLRDLAARHDLPWLAEISRYGSWRRAYPDVRRGRKRGFSYFAHAPGEPFRPDPDHDRELLVAASRDDEHADTHWLRSDVDHFFVKRARAEGIPVLERTRSSIRREGEGWSLELRRPDGEESTMARFLVDATGEAGVLADLLGLPSDGGSLRTNSRALYGHFEGVTPWNEILEDLGGVTEEHPFRCDDAAQHHILSEGWMWQLRFDHGVTSIGIAIDAAEHPLDVTRSAEQEWAALLLRYPSLGEQLAGARLVAPEDGLRRTGRLQRRTAEAAGPGWALLPNTAAFVDPLHSTGIAQTLCGVERLASIFQRHGVGPDSAPALRRYAETLRQEIAFLDDLVSGGYRSRGCFRLFAAFSMLYFAAATTYELRRLEGTLRPEAAFLCADEPELRERVSDVGEQLRRLLEDGPPDDAATSRFEADVARSIEPYNRVGLCDPSAHNLYRYTAVR